MMEQPFEPGFLRPQPPLHHCEEEVVWLNPTESQCAIQWDNQMCSSTAAGEEGRQLGGGAPHPCLAPTSLSLPPTSASSLFLPPFQRQ